MRKINLKNLVMKKKILITTSVIMLIIDILLIVLFWNNYMYHISDVDLWTFGIFIGVSILVESVIIVIHIMRMQEHLLSKILISISLLFVINTLIYKTYNDLVHFKLDYEEVYVITTNEKTLNNEEIKEFLEQFNDAKYIKRNLECEVVGTPDNTITIILNDDTRITLDAFGEQLAVWVSGRSSKNSCYWIEQDEIRGKYVK